MEPKVGAVVNPSSGGGAAAWVRTWLRFRLGERLDLCEVAPGVDVTAWVRSRAEGGLDRLLVCGGDGTFRSVASALLGSDLPVGLVATGTNNNIAAVLGLPDNPYRAAEVALTGEPEWISAGRIGDYVFFEGAGVGLEADLFPVGEAMVRRQFREVLGAPLRLARTHGVDIDIELDSTPERIRVRAFTLTISNTPMTGAHLKFAPGIDIRDPALFMTVYHDLSRLDMVRAVPSLRQGAHGGGYRAETHPFMRARIEAAEPLHVHADGTLIGSLPVEVEAIPRAVRVAMAHSGGP
ncbi:MAG TPA: diacylglycerol kinase family protein [Terriglobales bacterium]|nr:diacylglycerol kinase family protein [Terriglobales bacterium]